MSHPYTYQEFITPYIASFPLVRLTQEKKDKVAEFIERLLVEKQKEQVHKEDPFDHEKRFKTGFYGEAALEQLLGVDFMDTSVGASSKYRVADLKSIGLKVGIKSGEFAPRYNKFPLVNKNIRVPQVMTLVYGDEVRICGLATVEVLNKYVDDRILIRSGPQERKTGFYGYHKLLPFKTLEELKKLA